MPQRNSSKQELISLVPVIAVSSAGAALVITRSATATEAAGFAVAILAAIGWGSHRRR